MTGVADVAVEGESAASTAWESEVKVTIGGKIGSELAGGFAVLGRSGGPLFVGDRPLLMIAALGDGLWRSPNPLKEPKDPDSLFEKLFLLLCEAEPLLDTVDCDHRFRFPTPSRKPFPLSGRV